MNLSTIAGNRIKELISKNNFTIYKLAKTTCLHNKTLSNTIKGNTKDINLSTIYLVSNAFNMDILDFLKPDEFRNKNVKL